MSNIVEEYFEPWEGKRVNTWNEAVERINAISTYSSQKSLAWRGQNSAAWALHSSLYRKIPLITDKKFDSTDLDDRILQEIEIPLIEYLQDEWRFSDKSSLEILANIQHHHGSTRLIDVSLNALIALYFAVEENENPKIESQDARLFCFSIDDRIINLQSETWNTSTIPWAGKFRNSDKWCSDAPLFWKPPTYNPRIQVQHSGFLLAGVPKVTSKTGSKLLKGPGKEKHNTYWSVTQLREVSSVPLRMVSLESGKRTSELTFTLRIASSAKEEIRSKLSKIFNINSSSVYPDDFGAAQAAEKFINTQNFRR